MNGHFIYTSPSDLDGYVELLIGIFRQAVADARLGSEEACSWLQEEAPDLAQQLDQPSRVQGVCPDCGRPFAQGRGARAVYCPRCATQRQQQRLQAKRQRARVRGKV